MATAAPQALGEPFAEAGRDRPAGPRAPRLVEASFDPFENDMGEGSLQRFISEALRPQIERLIAAETEPTFVGADQYVGWHPDDPTKVVAPDVYVLPGVAPGEEFEFWKVWQTGIVPSFALEIVSKRKPKDYVDAPKRYADLGVKELMIFDPRPRKSGVRWQVYRRVARRGFVKVETTDADRVRSKVLGCWLRMVGTGKMLRIRLASDPHGDDLVPTAEEAERAKAVAERAKADAARAKADAAEVKAGAAEVKADAERARADAERARADAERAAREQADVEVTRLRAELAQRDPPRAPARKRRAR
jgi:Uma2 family endonuclease